MYTGDIQGYLGLQCLIYEAFAEIIQCESTQRKEPTQNP